MLEKDEKPSLRGEASAKDLEEDECKEYCVRFSNELELAVEEAIWSTYLMCVMKTTD